MSHQKSDNLPAIRHSLAHLLAAAVIELYPGAKNTIGPAIENGFYQDFDMPKPISEDDLPKIEKKMRELLKDWGAFERREADLEEARRVFAWNPYKIEMAEELAEKGEQLTIYTSGKFVDLCRGGHVDDAAAIKPDAFKLTKVSGAYWRGDQNRQQLQRVYGVAFNNAEELSDYLQMMEEAKERDHRKLGKELDLFAFSDLVGPGLPLFTPRGTMIRNLLKQALLQTGARYGGQEVGIPHIAKRELYEISGHAQKFSGELFEVKSHYDIDFVMKPVNCPHHTQIYAAQPRSYKDLPLSYMESTMQYRDEKPGQIGGLGRVRAITVDDGHLFCTVDQIKDEVVKFCNFIKEFHSALGMYGDHWVSLSVRDYSKPDQYIGDAQDWDKAEAMLEELANELKLDAKKMEGEAALYGPKLDFMYKDVLGNERQLSTVQLDFSTPKRFKLTYTDVDGSDKSPVMIHRAILGSYERFMAILLEKTAGWLPFWLAPEQVRILTINDSVLEYVDKIKQQLDQTLLMKPLKYNEVRYTLDDRSESLGRKIRDAVEMKIPVVLIVGNKDVEANQVSVRLRGKEEKIDLEKLQDYLQQLS